METQSRYLVIFYSLISIVWLFFSFSMSLADDDSVCARVKIEIKQELTLERQAFDAHMRINNGLTHVALENINVAVWATNEDGDAVEISADSNDSDALFFIRLDEMTNIENVSGTGQVPPDDSSDIHWLVIPAPGASNGLTAGTRYNIGATLTYTLGGEENTIEVSPDYIFVKPMPEVTLDYFLPSQIYGDDPFTGDIEAAIPFSLGVRVQNSGAGAIRNLKIDSAQPKIVDNDQGLLINFTIQGSEVNGEEKTESLLVDFGTITPNTASVARWQMTCSLSGKFVSFEASFTHADELGGELTSLISAVNTHTLVRDVLVDLPGRDGIKDFLSRTGSLFTVWESDNTQGDVSDLSTGASLSLSEQTGDELHYTLTTDPESGFIYASLPDPHNGAKYLERVVRSDGKQICMENAWLSKVQDAETHEWHHFVNLFDADNTAASSYTLVFNAVSASPQAPVLEYISDKTTLETRQVSFITQASDPNGTTPSLSASSLPAGAAFIDNGDGTAVFDWTPVEGQKGIYDITFTASDGTLSSERQVCIIVFHAGDTDMDGMDDDWEMTYFNGLDRDGAGDHDLDGVTDLAEFTEQTDPTLDESAPTTPAPLYPHPNIEVEDATPELVIENSTDTQNNDIDYEFEIYEDEALTQLVGSDDRVAMMETPNEITLYAMVADLGYTGVPRGNTVTSWQVPVDLPDNSRYYWRVRSNDQDGSSLWAYYDFFVNTANDPPGAFGAAFPEDNTGVDTLTPTLSVMNSGDLDNDVVTYTFSVFSDDTCQTLVAASGAVTQGAGASTAWTIPSPLEDQTYYYWQATADDGNGGITQTAVLTLYVDTANHAPGTPSGLLPHGPEEVDTTYTDLTVTNVAGGDQDEIFYIFELDTAKGFNSPDKQISDLIPEGSGTTSWYVDGLEENTQYFWRVKATDGSAASPWATASFFVNRINDAPSTPTIRNPGANAWTKTLTPVLSLNRAADPDNDTLAYEFEIYANDALTRFVYQAASDTPDWTLTFDLDNNTQYYWRARAVDEHGVSSPWTAISSFFIKTEYVNEAPVIEIMEPFEDVLTNAQTLSIGWTDQDSDSNASIALYYDTDNQGEDGVLIIRGLNEDDEGDQDIYTWDISSLADGTYYIYAVIQDEASSFTHYAPVTITIDRTPPELTVTPPAGEYEGSVDVGISTDEIAAIYYTLDGSTPDAGASQYTGPIELTDMMDTVILKCVAVDGLGNTSEVGIHEYTLVPAVVTVEVLTDSGDPIPGVEVRLFAIPESGNRIQTEIYATTDDRGIVAFDPDIIDSGLYQFRVKFWGTDIWSDVVSLPGTRYTKISISMETVELTLSSANGPVDGYNVYLFSESGSYLGCTQILDENGQVWFELPVGSTYRFMAEVLGTEYWIDPITVQNGGTNHIGYDAGGGLFTVTFQKDSLDPITDIKLSLYGPDGTALDCAGSTDANGRVEFKVTKGDYLVRADYLGYCFWTEPTTVSQDTDVDLTLPHNQVTANVSGRLKSETTPMEDVEICLFTADGTPVNLPIITDGNGDAVYLLPDRAYKIQATVLGQTFWSNSFSSRDVCINIPMARAKVEVNHCGTPMADIPVHLFPDAWADPGATKTTNRQGRAVFTVPAGTYTFKAEYNDDLYPSRLSSLAHDFSTPVYLSVGDGGFEFTVQNDRGQPIHGAQVNAFSILWPPIWLNSATDAHGHAFFDLDNGRYRFLVTYMDKPYLGKQVKLPQSASASITIPHQDVRIHLVNRNASMTGVPVYAFSVLGQYLGYSSVTDDSGHAVFNLPVGLTVRFRAAVAGRKVFTGLIKVRAGDMDDINLNASGGKLTLTLKNKDLIPISGLEVRLLTRRDIWTGYSSTTDINGQVFFEMSKGEYVAEAQYRGRLYRTPLMRVYFNRKFNFTLPYIQDPFIPPFIKTGTCD